MIDIEYTATTEETANATLDFMLNRPMLRILFLFMQIACIFLCIAFAIALYNKATRPQDFIACLTALGWLFYYKKINRSIIKSGLKKRKFVDTKCLFKIDEKNILYKFHTFNPQYVEWKKLKHVLKNKDGYIIPLTGMTNAGKFLWLPFRSLQINNIEQEFLHLVDKFKLKIKNLKT